MLKLDGAAKDILKHVIVVLV